LAASGVTLIPASADGALVIDDASGIRALLTSAGKYTSTLSPQTIGRTLSSNVGVDLLAEQPEWGLAKKGPRALIFSRGSIGLSAPIADLKSARRALEAWRTGANRAGKIASKRLFTASGPRAAALLKAMAKPGAFTRDKALLARATGPAWIYLKGRPPLRAAIFALDASAAGLIARGLVQPLRDPILAGPAPAPCDGSPPGCLRVGLGPSGRMLLSMALSQLRQPALPDSPHLVVRLDAIDAQQLSDDRSLPNALHISAADAPALAGGPALAGQLDLSAIATALARLTPLDAIHGTLAAGAYAANLIYAPFLRNSGPLTLTGEPAKTGADIEIRLPIR